MSGTLIVQNIQGPSSGANANKIIIPSGQTLDASAGFVPPAGSVVQVVNHKTNTQYTTTTTTFANMANFSVSITPTSASSVILLMAAVPVRHLTYNYGIVRWKRNGTVLDYASFNANTGLTLNNDDLRILNPYLIYDSPATTSPVTYSADFATHNATGQFIVNSNAQWSHITLMEIAG